MLNNTYTKTIDSIHVPRDMVERALSGAKLRAARINANQVRTRYAAAAASLVLASAAGVSMFYLFGNSPEPVKTTPAVAAAQSTEATAMSGTETASSTVAETVSGTQAATDADPTTPSINMTQPHDPKPSEKTNSADHPATQAPQATAAPAQPTQAPMTEAAPTEPPAETGEPEIDRSLLCDDGKLFIAVAATGLEHIDDPDAFTDDHLYYIDTKFGRYYRIQPFQIQHVDLSLNSDTPKSDEMCYLYNSDGDIVGQAPVWW